MNMLKNIGLVGFIAALGLFAGLNFVGGFSLSDHELDKILTPQEKEHLATRLSNEIGGQTFATGLSFGNKVVSVYDAVNDEFRANQQWDKVLYTPSKEFALRLTRAASHGLVSAHKSTFFWLTFGLAICCSLLYVFAANQKLSSATINNGAFQNPATNRGWIGVVVFVFLVTFYILLYYFPYALINSIQVVEPVKKLFSSEATASQWFLYGFMYCVVMLVMGVRMLLRYRKNNYQLVRTVVVVFFQVVFAFLLVEILPLFDLPARDLKNAWPLDYQFLFEWNVQELLDSGHFGKFIFVWGIILSMVIIPVMVYFFGKRWYCSWVCGCGGLAETLGDPYRHLSNKKMVAWKIERWLIHGVLVFAIIMTIFTGYLTYNVINHPTMESKEYLLGVSAYDVRELYGFLIGSIFAGVIGTGFYPVFGSRTWCRFGCPLAAYMGLVQRFKSRFRITTNGGQCISCGNCSTYCEQGIDVRAYAQKGQNIVRSSCVGCGVCASVCPRGVLKLENGPEEGRFGNEGPIVLGNNGFELKP